MSNQEAINNIKYASSLFSAIRKAGKLTEHMENSLASDVINDEGSLKIKHHFATRILHGLVLMLFSKQNPKRPVQ